MFEKLRTEQKFTPIYSPQCNGRIEGFHKFLKTTIAKQLETHVEWDDLVWKATAAYNFFPTESSGLAPFFLMFRWEAAVKHNKTKVCQLYEEEQIGKVREGRKAVPISKCQT